MVLPLTTFSALYFAGGEVEEDDGEEDSHEGDYVV